MRCRRRDSAKSLGAGDDIRQLGGCWPLVWKCLQKEPLQVTPAIRAKAADLTRGLQTDDEKIHAIYDFVSLRFHYIGLDFGIGRYQPHAAEDVLENGYGDCKDKHTLLASLLKAAGYEAWPVLIHNQRKLDPRPLPRRSSITS